MTHDRSGTPRSRAPSATSASRSTTRSRSRRIRSVCFAGPAVAHSNNGLQARTLCYASRTLWAGAGRDNQQPRKSRIGPAISEAWVSSAKCPVSKKRTTAPGLSRLNASTGRKNGSFLASVSPMPPSSRRWLAQSRPANLPERNGSPPPSSRSALATRGRG